MEKKKPYFGYAPKKSNVQKLAQYIEEKGKKDKVQKSKKTNNKRFSW